ncbi:hypothetical protein [Microvirga sp. TS319]|uniref:hypothetical protein n=1 Tax=Microvirga sp. TS319 TaxID=3241165 RepID=UPI00351A5172
MHVNSTLAQGLQILLAASSDQAASSKASLASKAAPASSGIVPLSSATKNIAGQIGAAMFDLSAKSTSSVPAGMVAVSDEFGMHAVSNEEFRAAVISRMREKIAQDTDHAIWDKASAQAFEDAVANGTISIERAQKAEGLDFKANRSVQIMEGRIVGQGWAPTYGAERYLADKNSGRDIAIGGVDGIGDFYLTFPSAASMKQTKSA